MPENLAADARKITRRDASPRSAFRLACRPAPRAAPCRVDVAAAVAAVTPVVEDVAARGYAAAREATVALRRRRRARTRGRRPRRWPTRSSASTRRCARRWRSRSAGPGSSTRRSAATTVDIAVVPGGTVTERWIPVARVGLYVPGGLAVYPSSVVMNVVPAQVAGVGSIAVFARRRRSSGAAAPDDPGRVRAARGRRGLRGRRRPGDRAGRLRRRGARHRAGRRHHRAGQHLRRRGEAARARRRRHRLRGRPDRDRDPGRRHRRPRPRRGRPASARPSTTRWRRPSSSPTRPRSPTRSTPRSSGRSALTKHVERVTAALSGPQSAHRAGRRSRAGPGRRRRLRRRAPRGRSPPTRARGPSGSATPAASSSARTRRCRSATTAPGPTTCCRPAGTARHASGLSVQSFLKGVHLVEYDRRALADVAPHVRRSPTPRTCRRTARRSPSGACRDRRWTDDCRSATSCAAQVPVRRAAARRAVQLNVNENPYPPSRGGRRRHRRGGGRGGRARSTATPIATPSSCAPTSRPT